MFKAITQHGMLPIMGLAFKLFLLIFTGLNTWHLLYGLSNDPVWSLIGVVLFEGALLYWWNMFRSDIEPTVAQIAISLGMFIVSLLLVLLASALELSAISTQALGTNTVARVIVIAVALNLAAAMFHSILSHNIMTEVIKRTVAGIVWSKAQTGLLSQTDTLAADLTRELTAQTWDFIEADVRRSANRSLGHGRQPVVIPGEVGEVGTSAPTGPDTVPPPDHILNIPVDNTDTLPLPSANGSGPNASGPGAH